jgi:LPXTG-motif cell wall-anchored protein
VRKFVGVALIGVVALFALPMLAAGAQTATTNGSAGSDGVPPDPPGDCVITSVTPNPVPAFPSQVTITGTAPSTDNTTVVLFADGVAASPVGATDVVSQAITDGTFTLKYTVNAPTNLSVNFTFGNQNAYTAICALPSGETVVRIEAQQAAQAARPSAQLAFTGSSDTPSFVLIGIAALVVGAVLVIAARRHKQVS